MHGLGIALAWQMRLGFGVWSLTHPISSDIFSIFQVHKCRIKYLSSANNEQTMVAYALFGLDDLQLVPKINKAGDQRLSRQKKTTLHLIFSRS